MGTISFSIPRPLVSALTSKFKVSNFIETGTFKGGTSIWAADHFEHVYTIEISPELSKYASEHAGGKSNIEFIVGDSRTELRKVVDKLTGVSLFWLDGHWCMNAAGKDDECPLIDELEAISKIQESIILIDDARCFLGPLPAPHNSKDWPRIDEIFLFIKEKFPNHTTTIIDDVIVSVPPLAKPFLEQFWQQTFVERFDDPAYTLKKYSFFQMLKSSFKNLIKG